ncbi:C6 transcription factor [Lasiodiplodia theobromae]|uniref:C6 transcription factor n=1 Tax=Lasiodiplodia theobromae TaxID=45133 RepID=UPI0015C2D78D|nr:C6 transcription factor [Lasiodiplodia theobromae]KAF4534591.1 C6 transcription factor [Lasiodiplodia theobromae]
MDASRPRYRVRFATSQAPATPSAPAQPLRPRQIKARTGCAACKRRRVKCDETQPQCRRCLARGEACSGPRRLDQWQATPPDPDLHYFSSHICTGFVFELRTGTTLLAALRPHITRSPALYHAIHSLCSAHRALSSPSARSLSLQDRTNAVAALAAELRLHLAGPSTPSSIFRVHCLAFGAAVLAVSTQWLDPSGRDCGLQHLRGANAALDVVLQHCQHHHQEPPADVAKKGIAASAAMSVYLIGLYVYLDMTHSFLAPAAHALPLSPALRMEMARERWRSAKCMHPITRAATSLCFVVARVGRYYRRVVDRRGRDLELESELERHLVRWQPLDVGDDVVEADLRFVDAVRILGLVMLEQARRVGRRYTAEERESTLFDAEAKYGDYWRRIDILTAYASTLLHNGILRPFLHPQFEGVFLLAVGPELDAPSARQLVEEGWASLRKRSRMPHHLLGRELVRECWRRRDSGSKETWLEVMVEKGLALMVG